MPLQRADIEKLRDTESERLSAALTQLEAAATDDERVAALGAYHEAFEARRAALAAALGDGGDAPMLADGEENAAAAEREAEEAEREAEKLKQQLAALDGAPAAPPTRTVAAAPYLAFLAARGEFLAGVSVMRNKMKAIVAESAFKMPDARDDPAELADSWDITAEVMAERLVKLSADADALAAAEASREVAQDRDVSVAGAAWKEVAEMAPLVAQKVADDKSSREATAEAVKDYERERQRLLLWCRQQKTNLDAMVEPDQVQEFCASLLANFPSMDDNTAVLLEIAEPLLSAHTSSATDVQHSLLEVNEVWLNLQISAYERLRHTLLEIHPKSRLEDEVRAFATYSTRASEFLNDFSQLLSQPSDAESQSAVRAVVEECARLQQQFAAHAQLADHLRDFALRMECLRDSYNNLRRAVFGRLTFLSSNLPTLSASMRRKEEYAARMKDLKKWVEVKAQGDSWAAIHERVVQIRDLIEAEQKLLEENPPVDPTAATAAAA